MKRILIPTDFSENAEASFAQVIEQAKYAGEHEIHLICVIEDLAPTSVQFEFALAVIDAKNILEQAQRKAQEKLEKLAPTAFPGLQVKTAAIKANKAVSTEIVDYARAHDIDLIVMATHGRGGLGRLLLGSVAENVLRQSSKPILLVPNDKQ